MNNIEENNSDNSANNNFISNNRAGLFGASYRMNLSAENQIDNENEIDNENLNTYRFNNNYTESIDNSGNIPQGISCSASLDRNDEN